MDKEKWNRLEIHLKYMKYMKEVASAGLNGWENVVMKEGKRKPCSAWGTRQRVKAIMEILMEVVVVGKAWQPSKVILRRMNLTLLMMGSHQRVGFREMTLAFTPGEE